MAAVLYYCQIGGLNSPERPIKFDRSFTQHSSVTTSADPVDIRRDDNAFVGATAAS